MATGWLACTCLLLAACGKSSDTAANASPSPSASTAPAAAPSLADRYKSFEDAKNDTLDTLLASIEAAEARLLEVKRTTTFEQLEPLANGTGKLHS